MVIFIDFPIFGSNINISATIPRELSLKKTETNVGDVGLDTYRHRKSLKADPLGPE